MLAYFAAVIGMSKSTDKTMDNRAKDWRMGAVVYQVFVDRFAPSADMEAKRRYYTAPRKLMTWDQTPMPGRNDQKSGMWSHEMEFWGGDLKSVQSKLGYVRDLGADVLYLTPIHHAFSNHKYDAIDYNEIDPGFGTHADLKSLITDVHKQKMRIMLDGVFNHVGRRSTIFQDALANPASPYRDWFSIGAEFRSGYKGWIGIANLPALHLENKGLRDYLWNKPDSVVKRYLNEGIDGWRLDVAYELGQPFLTELTQNAHAAKPGSAVVGEISAYPADWFPAVDGVFNFFAPRICIDAMHRTISGGRVGRMLNDMVADAGIENLLRSWILVDNHDTDRLANLVPDQKQRELALAMQFSIPGSPVVYYGTELGMKGSGDPQNRAPMRWDLVNDSNPTLAWTRQLIKLRKDHAALRYGDFRALETDKLIAFTRFTGKLRETVLVVANPTNEPVRELITARQGSLMSWQQLKDAFSPAQVQNVEGRLMVSVPPHSVQFYIPVTGRIDGHSQWDRIK